MAHPYKGKASDSRKVARERFQSGGNVVALPLSPEKTADALTRLKDAGIMNHGAARDFAASRMKSWGLDPAKRLGVEPKYKRGGKT